MREVQPAGWLDGKDTAGDHGGTADPETSGRVDRITGATLTYGELASLVAKAAVHIDSKGIKGGERVAINLTNSIDHFILTLGLLRLGVTPIGMTILAWLFVASRVVHTVVHTTSNNLSMRALVFAIASAPRTCPT